MDTNTISLLLSKLELLMLYYFSLAIEVRIIEVSLVRCGT